MTTTSNTVVPLKAVPLEINDQAIEILEKALESCRAGSTTAIALFEQNRDGSFKSSNSRCSNRLELAGWLFGMAASLTTDLKDGE